MSTPAPSARPRTPAFAPSLTAALAWGAMFPIAASAVARIDAFHVTAIRYLLACLCFVVLLRVVEGRGALSYEGRFGRLLFLGTLGFAGFNLLSYYALEFVEPQNAALIVATAPLVTAFARWSTGGGRPATVVLVLTVVAFGGVATVLGRGDPTVVLAGGFEPGDLLVLGGVIAWAYYTLGAGSFPHLSPLRYTTLTAVAGTAVIVVLTVVLDLTGARTPPTGADLVAIAPELAYVVLAGAVVGVLAWNTGVRRLGASNAALFMNLVPIVAFTVQILRGYDPAVGELVGAVVVVAALVAANRAAARHDAGPTHEVPAGEDAAEAPVLVAR